PSSALSRSQPSRAATPRTPPAGSPSSTWTCAPAAPAGRSRRMPPRIDASVSAADRAPTVPGFAACTTCNGTCHSAESCAARSSARSLRALRSVAIRIAFGLAGAGRVSRMRDLHVAWQEAGSGTHHCTTAGRWRPGHRPRCRIESKAGRARPRVDRPAPPGRSFPPYVQRLPGGLRHVAQAATVGRGACAPAVPCPLRSPLAPRSRHCPASVRARPCRGHARCRGGAAWRPGNGVPATGRLPRRARLMHGHVVPAAILWLPFAASFIVFVLRGHGRNLAAWLMTCTALACLVLTLSLFPAIAGGGALRHVFEWAPSLGLDFTLRVDGLAWLFMLLVSGIGTLVGVYARYSMSPDDPLSRFFALLLAFMGAMLGIVMSGNVVRLVFFWELTSLFSFLLIGYWHNGASARDGARMALVVTSGGGLCLLAGVLLLGHIVGSYDLDAILAAGDLVRGHALYTPALLLVLM